MIKERLAKVESAAASAPTPRILPRSFARSSTMPPPQQQLGSRTLGNGFNISSKQPTMGMITPAPSPYASTTAFGPAPVVVPSVGAYETEVHRIDFEDYDDDIIQSTFTDANSSSSSNNNNNSNNRPASLSSRVNRNRNYFLLVKAE